MLNTTIAKIDKKGAIVLSKKVRRSWAGADIYVRASEDTLILKKIYKPSRIFDTTTVKKLKAVGKKIAKKDIEAAIRKDIPILTPQQFLSQIKTR